jgi:hypothetical protein
MSTTAVEFVVIRWVARILALALFVLWGAFFLEHLGEWFLHPAKGLPPLWVWLMQMAHLGILLGMLALWKWEVAGSLLALASALTFFGGLTIKEMLAGHRFGTFLVFLAVTILPPVLTLVWHFAQAQSLPPPEPLPHA